MLADTSGSAALGGALDLLFGTFTPTRTESLPIVTISGGGTLSGTFSNFPTNGQTVGTFDGVPWYIKYNPGSNGSVVITSINPVPEPGSLTLLAAAGVGWLVRRRARASIG